MPVLTVIHTTKQLLYPPNCVNQTTVTGTHVSDENIFKLGDFGWIDFVQETSDTTEDNYDLLSDVHRSFKRNSD